jgi:(4-(4-[2-(gamma-L-glutamylamino)ethyl]phenoxymethyl)furan-2-yl)methanamine synthase
VKMALISDGSIVHVRQIACPLWRGFAELDGALAAALAVTAGADRHAVTMTGELADVFPDRYTGVALLVERLAAAFGPQTRFWMGRRGFGGAEDALAHYGCVASTNFLATAMIAARRAGDGLLLDMGSTTTDIVPLSGGREASLGLTDADRLRTGELVYTGLTRTPVMAVTARGLFSGQWQTLAREPFATMADVRRVLGTLADGVDQHATADGRGTSVDESRARLARCFGRDAEPGQAEAWRQAAAMIAEEQLRSLHDGAAQVLSRTQQPPSVQIVTAGIGSDVAAVLAGRLGMPAVSFGALVGAAQWEAWATRCAPAVAVAMLAA